MDSKTNLILWGKEYVEWKLGKNWSGNQYWKQNAPKKYLLFRIVLSYNFILSFSDNAQ